jgi:glycosyltransferase involved in cell wall biosynthesis
VTAARESLEWPDVDVVVATRDRPELLRACLTAILNQDYPGAIRVLVVFDHVDVDPTLVRKDHGRRVDVLINARSRGLAGSRNTGLLAATAPVVAFCDDDDLWLAAKLSAQVCALRANRDANVATCAIQIRYQDSVVERRLQKRLISFDDLLKSRLMELHPSTFVMRRADVLDGFGLVAEDMPGSYGEDYEFLLRAAQRGPIVNVDMVGAEIRWHPNSYFFSKWTTIVEGLTWLLERYPEFESQPRGYARISGQVAFAHAAGGGRRAALRWARCSIRTHPREPRGYLATAVALHLVSAERVQAGLHRRGRGI